MPVAISWGTAVTNGLTGHLIPLLDEYIPGAFQSIFMVPFGLYVLLVIFEGTGLLRGLIIHLITDVVFHLVALISPFKFFPDGGELIVPGFKF